MPSPSVSFFVGSVPFAISKKSLIPSPSESLLGSLSSTSNSSIKPSPSESFCFVKKGNYKQTSLTVSFSLKVESISC